MERQAAKAATEQPPTYNSFRTFIHQPWRVEGCVGSFRPDHKRNSPEYYCRRFVLSDIENKFLAEEIMWKYPRYDWYVTNCQNFAQHLIGTDLRQCNHTSNYFSNVLVG
jgi:hypothetical protein